MFRRFIEANIAVSRAINKFLPAALTTDGNYWFQQNVLRKRFVPGEKVFDVGGGSRPWYAVEDKQRLRLRIVGIDISADELKAAPEGSYDQVVATDITTYIGDESGDRVICQATLEHVADAAGAIRAIASLLKSGGEACIFAPCRNALFAQTNRVLPQEFKTRMLGAIYPYAAEGHDGFPAPYDRSAPSSIRALAEQSGLTVVEQGTFWVSGYFYFFVPAYCCWRIYQFASWLIRGEDACESFYFVLRKN